MASSFNGSAWNVDFVVPPDAKYRYNRNMSASVLAATALDAGALVLTEYDRAVIHGINRATRGDRVVLIDQGIVNTNSQIDKSDG